MKYKKIQRSILKVQQPTNKSFKKRKTENNGEEQYKELPRTKDMSFLI